MKIHVRLFAIACLFMSSTHLLGQERDGQSNLAAMREATSQLSRAEIWEGVKMFFRALKVAFRESRQRGRYDLPREDRFLLSLFTHVVIEKMYDTQAMGPAAMQLPQEYLLSAKKASIKDFATRLKKLPKDPFTIESMGWFPLVFFFFSVMASVAAPYQTLLTPPNRHVLLVVCFLSFILCVAQSIAKVYRLSRRLMRVYQGWVENLLAQQNRARKGSMGWG